ncbi:nodulin 21 -like transporter family protein [Nannochloropsis gaditana]|uniref:Nodulin 21-like transporter family protein n=1 Tax=Nannochloropsis gaditana TaxID=72520 RepID=W7TZA6_9STRA|nr:nodulin 21 -like transporter family protein [Nannochloropsis gaditana]
MSYSATIQGTGVEPRTCSADGESATLLKDAMTPESQSPSSTAEVQDTACKDASNATAGTMGDFATVFKKCFAKTCFVHPLMVLVQVIFSGYHVLTSSALKTKGVNPLVFALYRELSASLFMALYACVAVWRGKHRWQLETRHIPRFLALGLFSAGNVLGAVQALTLITPTNFSVLQPSIPVFTMLLSVLFRMERLTPLKALGLLAAVAGAVVVEVVHPAGISGQEGGESEGGDGSSSRADFISGNVIVLLQCLSMASLLVFQKTALTHYHPTVVTAWYYSIGSVLTLIICVSQSLPSSAYALSTSPAPWLALAYAALLGTAFNYNAYSWAGTVVAPGIISIYSTLQPVGTALLSVLFLHATITGGEMGGGGIGHSGLGRNGVGTSDGEEGVGEAREAGEGGGGGFGGPGERGGNGRDGIGRGEGASFLRTYGREGQ